MYIIFCKEKTAYELRLSRVGSEMGIRDRGLVRIRTISKPDSTIFAMMFIPLARLSALDLMSATV